MFIPSRVNKKYYLAGPMTNIPQFNYPKFFSLAKRLREEGYTIISPAELDSPETVKAAMASPDGKLGTGVVNGETWGDFLARDVKLVADKVDGIFVMDGWEKSRGARLELFVAFLANKPVFSFEFGADGMLVNRIPDVTLLHGITDNKLQPFNPGQLVKYPPEYYEGIKKMPDVAQWAPAIYGTKV